MIYIQTYTIYICMLSVYQCSHKVISNWLLFTANEVKVTDLVFLYYFWPSSITTDLPWPLWAAVPQMLFVTRGDHVGDVVVHTTNPPPLLVDSHHFLTNGMWAPGEEWGVGRGVFIFAFSVCQVLFIGMPLKSFNQQDHKHHLYMEKTGY